jgi:hypothetical protein
MTKIKLIRIDNFSEREKLVYLGIELFSQHGLNPPECELSRYLGINDIGVELNKFIDLGILESYETDRKYYRLKTVCGEFDKIINYVKCDN